MDDSPDSLQQAPDQYDRVPRQLPKIEPGVWWLEQYDGDDRRIVADPYLLYRSAISLATQVDQFFEYRFKSRGIELAVQVMEAVAELGTVLLSPPRERGSSSMACLKRALQRISTAIEAAKQLEHQKILSSARSEGLTALLFEIRDGIIAVMGDCRSARRLLKGLHRSQISEDL